jgi:RHS repeat-associated protein
MAAANPFRFSTKYQDDETDLLYYGYRYYSASMGRWMSRDPLGQPGFEPIAKVIDESAEAPTNYVRSKLQFLEKGDPARAVAIEAELIARIQKLNSRERERIAGRNLYAFVGNSPLTQIDPTGLQGTPGSPYTPPPGAIPVPCFSLGADAACTIYCAFKYGQIGFCTAYVYEDAAGNVHVDVVCKCFSCGLRPGR